jgi:PAS domain S-box-containing protein
MLPTALPRALVPYATAALAVAVALAVKFRVAPLLETDAPFLLFHAAVLFAAWWGGVGPGLLATGLAVLAADYYFVPPVGLLILQDDPHHALRLLLFIAEGTFISALSGLRLRSSTEAYRRAEELRVTLASIGDGVLTVCPDGRVKFLNPRAEELTGWSSQGAVGRPVGEVLRLIDEGTRESVDGPVVRALRTGRPTGIEGRRLLVARDGTERPIGDSAAPIRDRGGELLGVVVVFRDISDRRRTEEARAETLRRTTAILESIGDAFYALDREWRYTYVNAHAERYFGRPKEAMLGRVVWDVLPQARGTAFEAEFGRAVGEGVGVRFEAVSPVTGRWVEVAAYPSADGLAVYFRDVSDRKTAEETQTRLRGELEAERALLRAVLDQMPAGVVVADAPSGRVILSNALARLPWDRGWSEAERDGPGEGPAAGPLDRLLARAVAGETIRGAEVTRDEADGRPTWYRVGAAPVRAADGAVPWAVLILDDVTAEKQAEAVLRRSHSALESRVEEQGAALYRTAVSLEAAEARRREAERARQQLVARLTTISEDERRRVSRELHDETSQHLAALVAGLRTVRDRLGGDHPAAGPLERLQQQADGVGRSIGRIAWELRPAALDAVGLEAAVHSWVERWAEWAGVRADFHSTLGPGRLPPEVETQLYRLIAEALANVLKHARATRVGVSLGRARGTIVAAVEDDGVGFDPEAAAARQRLSLGLLGMRERAALLGGVLEIESAPGRGTTVVARIPHPLPREDVG